MNSMGMHIFRCPGLFVLDYYWNQALDAE
jgi:hypothetical protein